MQSAQLFCSIYKLKLQANWMQSSWLWAGSPFLFHSASGVLRGQSVWLRTTHHAACSRMLHCWNTYGSCETFIILLWYRRGSSPKNESSIIIYSPSSLSDLFSSVEYKCLSVVFEWKSKLFGSQLSSQTLVSAEERNACLKWRKLSFLCGLSL